MRRTMGPLLCAGALLMGTMACSDDGDDSDDGAASETTSTSSSTTAAESDASGLRVRGEDVELVGSGLGTQTLNIDVEEQDGEVTGQFQITNVVVRADCTDTPADGVIVLGGEVTTGEPGAAEEGDLLALVIREGDPESLALVGNDVAATTCTELVGSIADDTFTADDLYNEVQAGSTIEIT